MRARRQAFVRARGRHREVACEAEVNHQRPPIRSSLLGALILVASIVPNSASAEHPAITESGLDELKTRCREGEAAACYGVALGLRVTGHAAPEHSD